MESYPACSNQDVDSLLLITNCAPSAIWPKANLGDLSRIGWMMVWASACDHRSFRSLLLWVERATFLRTLKGTPRGMPSGSRHATSSGLSRVIPKIFSMHLCPDKCYMLQWHSITKTELPGSQQKPLLGLGHTCHTLQELFYLGNGGEASDVQGHCSSRKALYYQLPL